jgi:DNA-binding MarR family transcriptional regulator
MEEPANETVLPEALFHAIAYLLPGLNQVAQECEISIGEWIIMWHLRQAGVRNDAGQFVVLRQDLTSLLELRGFGGANVVRLLNSLQDKGLVRRVSLTTEERDQLFMPSDSGNRQSVVLQVTGDQKIEEFKKRLTTHLSTWRSEESVLNKKAVESARGLWLQFAEWFFRGDIRHSV